MRIRIEMGLGLPCTNRVISSIRYFRYKSYAIESSESKSTEYKEQIVKIVMK